VSTAPPAARNASRTESLRSTHQARSSCRAMPVPMVRQLTARRLAENAAARVKKQTAPSPDWARGPRTREAKKAGAPRAPAAGSGRKRQSGGVGGLEGSEGAAGGAAGSVGGVITARRDLGRCAANRLAAPGSLADATTAANRERKIPDRSRRVGGGA